MATTDEKEQAYHPRYHNQDSRCQYPDSPGDYCWSYAHHVDLIEGKKDAMEKFRDLEGICRGCEFFNE